MKKFILHTETFGKMKGHVERFSGSSYCYAVLQLNDQFTVDRECYNEEDAIYELREMAENYGHKFA